jgi:hypothetical protein
MPWVSHEAEYGGGRSMPVAKETSHLIVTKKGKGERRERKRDLEDKIYPSRACLQ